MSKVLASIHIVNKSACDFKNVFLISEEDFNLLQEINPYFNFYELTGRHENLEFYIKDVNFQIVTKDKDEIALIEKLGIEKSGLTNLDLLKWLDSTEPKWRDNVFEDTEHTGFDTMRDFLIDKIGLEAVNFYSHN